MLNFKLVYSDDYRLPLGAHVFPAQKFRAVHQALLSGGVADAGDFVAPDPARDEDVLLAHTPEWVRSLRQGTLTRNQERALEVPYSPELARGFWLHAGGSMRAAALALEDGISVNLGGGFHHAFPGHGEGFCMINDIAIAILRLMKDRKVRRAMVVDCDVHQGNGTAVIFHPLAPAPPRSHAPHATGRNEVFTVSLHQEHNYPAWKPPSCMDVNLPDGLPDAEYLDRLAHALRTSFQRFHPELIAYVAGADPYYDDQLGGLALTFEGLKQRDGMVFGEARKRGIPVFACFAGGYARRVQDTVNIHVNTVIAAQEVARSSR
jgi:acetoin utilization deacetylase AcuC-like enzyme